MPKQIFKIDQFHGGLSTNSDPRDIADNELSAATDVMVDELGKIRNMGGITAHASGANAAYLNHGYGLHYFSHDRKLDSLLITAGGSHGRSVGNWVGNNSDFTHADSSVGIVYEVPSATTMIVSKHKTGNNVWANTNDIFYSSTYTDSTATDVTENVSGTPSISTPETGEDYLAMADTDTAANIDIYDSTGDVWRTEVVDLDSTTGMKPTFYVVDGALRVSDAEFGNSNTNRWYGYIKRSHFWGLTPGGSADSYDAWYSKGQAIAKPTRGLYGATNSGTYGTTTGGSTEQIQDTDAFTNFSAAKIDAQGYIATGIESPFSIAEVTEKLSVNALNTEAADDSWYPGIAGQDYRIYPPAGKGFNLRINLTSDADSTWAAGDYELSTTFIYDGIQESLPFEMASGAGGGLAFSGSVHPSVGVYATSPFNPRITGGKVYYRIHRSNDEWKFLMEISLKNGGRTSSNDSWVSWTEDESSANSLHSYIYPVHIVEQDLVNTYQLSSGASQDLNSIYAKFKTAVVVNRMVYIGNIWTKDLDGNEVTMGDAMIKSPVNKFDVFPLNRLIEATINDGDNIVKLEEYADRILQFKKNKMHLINISQDIEFLEDTFTHKGVSHPAATCKTDFGIAWVNKLGCYLYDGQKVNNLLEKGGRQIIKESDWESFITDNSIIGYVPKKRQLIVLKDCSASSVGDIYLYDLVTQSWVEGNSAFTDSQIQTNFVTDWNGDLVHAHTTETGTVVKWDDDSANQADVDITTKDIDFGQPGQKKKVYKVYITYKCNGTTPAIRYDTNGDTGLDKTFNEAFSSSVTQWTTASFTPSTSNDANNIYSIRLRIYSSGSSTTSTFTINDISIVYRLKTVK